MANVPSLTITGLGTRGSGKTTFLLGMYAELSAGRDGYFLSATDPDVDLRLAAQWDKMLDDGALPPPNQADNIPYRFRFLDGVTSLLDIDWLDYRGGALEDERGSESGDVQGLHDRLVKSDSIYLVVDGGYFVEPVTDSTRRDILRRTSLRRMSALIQKTLQERMSLEDPPPPPSFVILITKSDLLPPPRRDELTALAGELQDLVSVCFSQGLSTLICPVSLGDFGMTPAAKIRTEDIEPVNLHLPIVYSLAEYMYQLSIAAMHVSTDAAEIRGALAQQLDSVRSGAGAFFRRSKVKELQDQIAETQRRSEGMGSVSKSAQDRADALFTELERLPRFRDGFEVKL